MDGRTKAGRAGKEAAAAEELAALSAEYAAKISPAMRELRRALAAEIQGYINAKAAHREANMELEKIRAEVYGRHIEDGVFVDSRERFIADIRQVCASLGLEFDETATRDKMFHAERSNENLSPAQRREMYRNA